MYVRHNLVRKIRRASLLCALHMEQGGTIAWRVPADVLREHKQQRFLHALRGSCARLYTLVSAALHTKFQLQKSDSTFCSNRPTPDE